MVYMCVRLFLFLSKGDFRVSSNSPALKTGFVNFVMDQFGVRKPSLKAIAKNPKLPQIAATVYGLRVSNQKAYSWMGILLLDPIGDQWSAYGVRYTAGGVALSKVDEASPAYKLGFRSNDLIQEINGLPVKNSSDLKQVLENEAASSIVTIVGVRKQQPFQLKINQALPKVQ